MTFVEATAQQLAWQRARDEVEEDDLKLAEKLVKKWNEKRIKLGLRPVE